MNFPKSLEIVLRRFVCFFSFNIALFINAKADIIIVFLKRTY